MFFLLVSHGFSEHSSFQIADYTPAPDISYLSDRPRLCLQESAVDIPLDYTSLIDTRLFSLHSGVVADAIRAYETLGVKHEPLRLITPQFETPLPSLQAAVSLYKNYALCLKL